MYVTHTHTHTYTLHRNLQNSLEFQSCFIQKTGIDLVILYTNSLIFSLFFLSEIFFPPLSTGEPLEGALRRFKYILCHIIIHTCHIIIHTTGEPIEGALRRFKIAVSRSGHLMELRRRRYAVCFHFFFEDLLSSLLFWS